jgi:diguanylate cyclase (GGDEF)-like protein
MEEALRTPTVLIANDQEWSARSLETIFAGEGYSVIRAFTGSQAIAKAHASLPDVIILDRQMPDLDGATVCRRLREDPRVGAFTPILITTAGAAGRNERLEALQSGAWDFFGQPIDGEAILWKVRTFVQAKFAVDRAREGDGLVDPETGLYTRHGLSRRAREIASGAMRNNQPVACVVFAPDTPALVDALLTVEEIAREVAQFFRESGRSGDAVARVGPLEFAVIAPGTSAEGATRMLERLEAAVARDNDKLQGSGRLTLRAGYYAVPNFAEQPIDPEEMIQRAGAALKVAS